MHDVRPFCVGWSVEWARDGWLRQGGVFTENFEALDSGNDGISTDGRIVVAPKLGKAQLHLGASAHWRRIGDSVGPVRYRQRPLIHNADIRFISKIGRASCRERVCQYV